MDTYNKTEFLKGNIAYIMDSEETFTEFIKWCEDNQLKINQNVYNQDLIHRATKDKPYYAWYNDSQVGWRKYLTPNMKVIPFITNEPKTYLLSWLPERSK